MNAGQALVIVDDEDMPAGYALVGVVDEFVHLEQLSVDAAHGRRGLGASLLEHVCDWVRERSFPGFTLTTFVHVAWNAPFYTHHGFRVLDGHEFGPELREVRDMETGHGGLVGGLLRGPRSTAPCSRSKRELRCGTAIETSLAS